MNFIFITLCICTILIESAFPTPTGFIAVRGKKADSIFENPKQEFHEIPSEIIEEYLGLRPNENKLLGEYLVRLDNTQGRPWEGFNTYSQHKRTPYGFVGVRGRRAISSTEEEDN